MPELRRFFLQLLLTLLLTAILPLLVIESLCAIVTEPVVAFVKRKSRRMIALTTLAKPTPDNLADTGGGTEL